MSDLSRADAGWPLLRLESHDASSARSVGRAPAIRTVAVFHVGDASGPLLSLKSSLAWLAEAGAVEAVLPWEGSAASHLERVARITAMDYTATLGSVPRSLVSLPPHRSTDLKRFRALFRRLQPNLVVVATTVLPAPLLAARAEGIPTILYAAELFDPEWRGRLRATVGRALARTSTRLADATICCSKRVRAQLARDRDGRILTIYPDIPPDIADGDRARFRQSHEIDEDAVCIGVAGNITRGRGQDLMLHALTRIREQIPNACCMMAGTVLPRSSDRAYRDELGALINELDLTAAVRWCGSVERMADFYAAADIVVNPARHCESFGRAAVEALVAGRPVVSTRVGAVSEVLQDGQDALLVDNERPDQLAMAVIRLASDAELGTRLADRGAQRARQRFTAARAVQPFGELVSVVTAAPSR